MVIQIQKKIFVTHCSGGTLTKQPKSNISVLEDGQDYSDSLPGHDPESPETNPEEASKVEPKPGPESPLGLSYSLKPWEDDHNMESEGSEDPKSKENNETPLEVESPVSHTETNQIPNFEEKTESKTNAFNPINFESLLVKEELTMQKENQPRPNPIPMKPTDSLKQLGSPSDIEHGQDYANSEPESKLKPNNKEEKRMKERNPHK